MRAIMVTSSAVTISAPPIVSDTRDVERTLAKLRDALRELFPELTPEEVDAAMARMLMYARRAHGLPDLPERTKKDKH